ncbi:pyridoxamine 5'-phosphate oxidase family protein [Ilumatobacter sp.]|uniref:pyridoxamine 5'-phosphate oxidase family protein n=1 Tax=Ilumatobacter sp. TaxID=1967498 RepID=UPI003C607C25
MSIPVELDVLEAKTREYGWAYLLTVGDDMRPKIVACQPEWHDGTMCFSAGSGSARNATARASVTVTFPPLDPDGYTLIVDGDATIDESGDPPRVHVAPTGGVLHRASAPDFTNTTTGCSHDCAPVDRPAT